MTGSVGDERVHVLLFGTMDDVQYCFRVTMQIVDIAPRRERMADSQESFG